mmetsp:Transcript_22099/g.61170  ORF Transcript_22099/g.61170 Transcript_22099/m.61170 type:complete len:404 (-) Transcript_22099:1083-2294(-)
MVLTWVTEPSPILSYTQLPSLVSSNKGTKFSHTPRFKRDGTNNQEKHPNFLNGWDRQGLELEAHYVDVDTNTHTTFKAPLMHGERHFLDIAEQVNKGPWTTPAIRSRSPKDTTSRSLISNDSRYTRAKDSYAEPRGPGDYRIEDGLPSMGTYPKGMASRGSSPSRNPDIPSASFLTTSRPDPFPPHFSPENWFLGTGTALGSNIAPWADVSPKKRVEVPDYRFAGRFSEAKKEVPYDAQYPAAERMNRSGDLTRIGEAASPKKGRFAQTSFQSVEPRLAQLPRERNNDMRLSRKERDDDAQWLGPGAYTPLISTGGAKRKTYRLFNVSQPPTGSTRPVAGQLGARSSMAERATSNKRGPPTKHHSLRHIPKPSGNSSSFTSITRNHKYGPHTWSTDSALTHTL